ncbi:VOC family protein [Seohaeicola zhoushanensis]|uniref:VOC domain-containing protein n=1 Tax=Seohaeicola zhoushanensis TaxID=1569283 RepID=A0A8J3M7T1_9RHOB|nr:VOC family protein [Seohaeicola zhoushanensis]GHF49561.1 hypothetical protein GCM10017056_21660 [Seohaeicola zhoushanensis]
MTNALLSFSHVGIFVKDIEPMAEFYQKVLGLVVTDRGDLPGRTLVFMSGDAREHHQVVLATGRTGDLNDKVVNQISFRVETLEELQAHYRRISKVGGASDFRAVNHGNAWTLYFRDPELNRIEIFTDAPWYIAQPCAEPLDLDKSAEEIRAETRKLCEDDPTFVPIEVWRERIAKKIADARALN